MSILKRRWKLFLPVFLLLGAAVFIYFYLIQGLPSLDTLPERLVSPSVQITDRNGRTLYELLGSNSGRHTVLGLEQIPQALRQATIATEDASFYSNPGIDLNGILRAFWIDLRSGRILSGGSTITQQVARNLLLNGEQSTDRSLRRKLRESLLAWQLTRRLSKDDILALYLNQSYYGGLAYGVDAASQTFFDSPPGDLDLAECALLAGLPQAPGLYNPFDDLAAAKKRQDVVLTLMEKNGYITAQQHSLAKEEPLVFSKSPYPIEAPHFVMMVRSQLDQILTSDQIYQHGGLIVRTTLDLDWQHQAEDAVKQQLSALQTEGQQALSYNVNDAALVALDPHTGQILAMVGSPDYFSSQNSGAINMAVTPRQPGSALKPLIYATAFDPTRPGAWTPATMILDVTTSFVTHDGQAYIPANYDNLEHGPVLARTALASSLNIPAVKTLNFIGLKALFTAAGRMGITTLQNPDNYDLSLALGGGEVSLLQLSSAYGDFATGGIRHDPYAILDIRDPQGKLVYKANPPAGVRVLDERVAWLISDILSDDTARAVGFGRNSALNVGFPTAVKTGTTSNFTDNWTVGYTPNLVVGVWAGNANHQGMRNVNGLSGAGPIWHQFIRSVMTGQPETSFKQPPGLVQVDVCALSGLLPSPACPYHRLEWFIEGTQPTQPDSIYHPVVIDSATGLLADNNTPSERRSDQLAYDLPPQAANWAHTNHLLLLSDLRGSTPAQSGSSQNDSQAQLSILSPADHAIYMLAPGFDASAQSMQIQVGAAEGLGQVNLWLDGKLLTRFSAPPYQFLWQLTAGSHELWTTAVSADGSLRQESAHVHFEVK
jgi:1A family penicillin-binding protein